MPRAGPGLTTGHHGEGLGRWVTPQAHTRTAIMLTGTMETGQPQLLTDLPHDL